MAFIHIKNLLHKTIGLHVDTIGESSIDRAINHRMHETNCSSASDYYKLVKVKTEEFSELVEEVVVPETWFFRNITPFEVLRDNAVKIYKNILKGYPHKSFSVVGNENKVLRVLSIPCSTGEEPYSIAMMLRESGLNSKQFVIDAVDISQRALKKSRCAIYGNHSFREDALNFKNKYFEKVKSGYRILPEIKDHVVFHQGNIFEDKLEISAGKYDVVFCRNLLIYFDRETQKGVLKKLSMALKNGGILFVGHAEAGQIDKEVFSKIRVAKAFAFRKKKSSGSADEDSSNADCSVSKLKDIYDKLVEVTKKDVALSKKINDPKYKNTLNSGRKKYVGKVFKKIDEYIDTGELTKAYAACEEILHENQENSEIYYYLGLVRDLQGKSDSAEVLIRKAIYLSPYHLKALSLAIMLAEKRGDVDSVVSLRRRKSKARERNV